MTLLLNHLIQDHSSVGEKGSLVPSCGEMVTEAK